MTLLQRITTPLNAMLPDLNNVPQRSQAVGAIVASLVVHLLLLLLFLAMAGLMPDFPELEFKQAVAEPQPLEVQIVSLPEAAPEFLTPEQLQARAERAFIDSAGLAKANAAPENAVFESDENMQAASEKPASGDAPLPSQDGKELPFQQFETKDVILGSAKLPPADLPLPAPPLFKPQPVAPEQTEARPAATPAPAAPATPPPLPDVVSPNDHEIAVAEKAPGPVTRLVPTQVQPRPMPVNPPPQFKTAPQELTKLITPPPRPMPAAPEAGFQAQTEKTKIEGSISNRGKAAVDAVKTPLAIYKKQVNAAIGSRWYFYVKQRRDLITLGSAKVSYAITKEGKITDIRIVENTSNAAFGMICEQSIREAEIGPPPDEAQSAMNDGRLEGDLTFTYYAGF
jgi:outer membrane biosynthesis protein TonB